jgi:peptidyl-prolyl cis-trans isomerase C
MLFVSAALIAGTAFAQNVAVVNNKAITKSKVDEWVKQTGQPDSPDLRGKIKDHLIERELLLQEATKRGIDAKPDVKFQLDVVRQNTLIQALIKDELDKNPISDQAVQADYDKHVWTPGERQYHARHILVDKEDEAKDIIEQLKKGAKFEDLAKKSKDVGSAEKGGDLDWASPAAFVKPFSDAMVALEKGKFTETPVKSQFGYHVIMLDDVRNPPLDQVRTQIADSLKQQHIPAFVEELKKKAKIQ